MRRFYAISLSLLLLAGLFLGCTKQAPKDEDDNTPQPGVKIDPDKPGGPKKNGDAPKKQDAEKLQKYDEGLFKMVDEFYRQSKFRYVRYDQRTGEQAPAPKR